MKINKKYQVITDSNSILVQEKVTVKSGANVGGESWKTIGWYSSFEGALYGLATKRVRDTGFADLKTVSDEINKIKNDIQELDICVEVNENREMKYIISNLRSEINSLKQRIVKLGGKVEDDEQA